MVINSREQNIKNWLNDQWQNIERALKTESPWTIEEIILIVNMCFSPRALLTLFQDKSTEACLNFQIASSLKAPLNFHSTFLKSWQKTFTVHFWWADRKLSSWQKTFTRHLQGSNDTFSELTSTNSTSKVLTG